MAVARACEDLETARDVAAKRSVYDEEPLISDEQSSSEEDRWRYFRRPLGVTALSVLGLVAMASCTALLAHRHAQHRAAASTGAAMSPRRLFESPEFVDVATENVILMSGGYFNSAHRHRIRAQVESELQNYSRSMWERFPQEGEKLDTIALPAGQQVAILSVMRHLSDPRVQKLGREIALAALQGMNSSEASSPEAVQRYIQDYISPRAGEIAQLRDEVIPEEIRGAPEVSMEPEGLQLRNTFDGWDFRLEVAQPQTQRGPGRRLQSASSSSSGSSTSALESEMETDMATEATKAMIINQANAFWKQLNTTASEYGINLEPLRVALNTVDVQSLTQCVMANLMTANLQSLMQCGMQFAQAAMVVFQTLMGHPPPTTTTPAWSVHSSFEDMMAGM